MLSYRTPIPVDDVSESDAEAEEIWARFRPNVEKAQLTFAMLLGSSTGRGRLLCYSKSSDGGPWVSARPCWWR
jgi:hypothetical protein